MISKKLVSLGMALVLLATMAGCGGTSSTAQSQNTTQSASGKDVEIEFVQVKREAADTYTKLINEFSKKHPNIKIKQNVVPDAQEVLMTRASSGKLPDMMNHWPTDAQYIQFADEGLLLDLSDKEYLSGIKKSYLDAVKRNGKVFIAPLNLNFMGLYYNADKFKQAGLSVPKTWDELIKVSKAIKAKGETAFLLPNKDSWTVSQLWMNIEGKDLGQHSEIYAKIGSGKATFSDYPAYKSSLEKMIQLLDYSEPNSMALGYDQAINDFANGKGWMFIQGSWALPSIKAANPKMNVKMAVLPNDKGDMKAVVSADTGFCVNANLAKDPDKLAAVDAFLSFVFSKEGAQIYADNDKSYSCVDGVSLSVPEFQDFQDYANKNGTVMDVSALPTGFEDTKRGKIQNVLLDKNVDAFLNTMTEDFQSASSGNK